MIHTVDWRSYMEQIPCVHCGTFFIPRNRRQNYCTEEECQHARRTAWQRHKMKTDVDYRTQQRLSQRKWVRNTPSYWKKYRRRNPDKAKRNRILQGIRNRRNRQPQKSDQSAPCPLIAKMDVRKPYHFNLVGQFYLVPLIAKMDVSKVNIYTILDGYR